VFHTLKLYYPDSRIINARAYSFSVHIVSLWNPLRAATVLSGNLQRFITSINNIDFFSELFGKV